MITIITKNYSSNNESPQCNRRLNQSLAQQEIKGIASPRYPLQIKAIPLGKRLNFIHGCWLIHVESCYHVPGQFSYEEATEIQKITRNWDWRRDKEKKPRCSRKLLALLETMLGQEEYPNRFPLPAQKKAAKGGAANA